MRINRRWAPDGSYLIAPNCMNGPVFVAGVIDRSKNFEANHSLVGHQNIVTAAAYSPMMFLKDPKKPITDGTNVVALFALAARSSISIWISSVSHPLVILEDVFDRDILDLQWSRDSKQLWASSSEGHVGVFSFELEEFGSDLHVAPEGAKESFHQTWNFTPAPRSNPLPNQVRPVATSTQPVTVIPQKTTIMANGKKRITPSLLTTSVESGVPTDTLASFPTAGPRSIVFPGVTSAPSPARKPIQTSGASAVFATASGPSNPFKNAPITSTSISKLPSRAPSPSQMRLSKQPASISYDDQPLFASSSAARDMMPPNLETDFAARLPKHNRQVKGATLGQNREREKIVIEEIAPAFIPDENDDFQLAVPSIKTYLKVTIGEPIDVDEEVSSNHLECRNYKNNRPTEVAHLATNGNEKTLWVDYLQFKVVSATWNGVFGAVSTSEGGLTVYSNAGRKFVVA